MTFASHSRRTRLQSTSPAQRTIDFEAFSATVAAPTQPVAATEPECAFAHRFAVCLEDEPGRRFDHAAVLALGKEVFGSVAGHARDIYDAVEAGFNLYLDRLGLDPRDGAGTLKRLRVEARNAPSKTSGANPPSRNMLRQ